MSESSAVENKIKELFLTNMKTFSVLFTKPPKSPFSVSLPEIMENISLIP